jgi:hypothetical protein
MQKLVRKDKEDHYILIKGTIQQEDTTILYAVNVEAPTFIKQTLLSLKEQIEPDSIIVSKEPDSIIVSNLNITLSSIDRIFRQKINKDILELNNTFNKINLADICRAFHPTTADYTFFSAAHGTFSKIYHIIGHKANVNNTKKVK